MSSGDVAARMREDWNQRASEDAHYYVAFGRRNQDPEEFFASGAEQVRGLEMELKRLPPAPVAGWRALEIGCGPGRLMRPLSRHFAEIHGVDISDAMIAKARANLAGVPHAHAHHAPDSDLRAFVDASFDFVYSYAVFQHIPSRDVVMGYLREAARVLKPGGILRCQINGLPEDAKRYDTWSGVRISADEVRAFAKGNGMDLLALEGTGTQYMWVTMRRRPAVRIRRITNAHSSEPLAPVSGRFASVSLWVEGLPGWADLNRIEVRVGGRPGTVTYLGPAEMDGLQQLNMMAPGGLETGLREVDLVLDGQVAARGRLRMIRPGPAVPRVLSVTDGIDLLSGRRVVTGSVKVTLEEVSRPEEISVEAGGRAIEELEVFCTDPRLPRYEVNFEIPKELPDGEVRIGVRLAKRGLGTWSVENCRRVSKGPP